MSGRSFPSGDVAFQERYLVAFRGLTEMLISERSTMPWTDGAGDHVENRKIWEHQWSEMFEVLNGEKELLDAEAPEGQRS